MLNSVITGTEITATAFLLCTAVSLILGLGAAALNMYKNKYSQSFVLTLAMLPAIVQLIINQQRTRATRKSSPVLPACFCNFFLFSPQKVEILSRII